MLSMLMQNFEANVGKPEFQKSAFATIQGAVTRMQSIISKLKDSELATAQTVSNCNLADIVVNLREKLGLDGLDGISYSEQLDEISPIEVDAELLGGVIENLIVNAIEAMPHGGELTICVTEDDGTPAIEVKDSGIGMDPEFINKKLFKPFETTKRKGLGIGLYQSRDQLERMGGRFKVTSKRGEGTGFKVLFPRGERSPR
jgi:signal transduction histidine kinase